MPTPLPNLHDWRFSVDFEGIAWALMDREGESMNSLGRRLTEELGEIVAWVEQAAMRSEIKGLVIMSGKPSGFLVGADIREFERFDTEPRVKEVVKETLSLFDRIAALPVPVVVAIHGYCLGGGLELALACHWRIADREEGTRLGFPEVKLGIFPGLNGTVRSIQLAGPMDAMTAMLTGRMLRPAEAKAMGLIDQVVPSHHNLRWAARKAVLQKRRNKGAPWWKQLMLKQPVRGLLAKQMRAKTAAKVREEHYPAPFRLIDLFEEYGDDPAAMRVAETEIFAPLMAGETSRNLRRVFMLSEMLKDEAPKDSFKPPPGARHRRGHHGGRHRRLVRGLRHAGEPARPRRRPDQEGARPRQEPVPPPASQEAGDRRRCRAPRRRSARQAHQTCRCGDRGDRREARGQADAVPGARGAK